MKDGYVLLNLNQEPTFPQSFASRKSLWRSWNRLSRLQRNLISGTCTFLCFLSILYFWKNEDYYPNNDSSIYDRFKRFERLSAPTIVTELKDDYLANPPEVDSINKIDEIENIRRKEKIEPIAKPKIGEIYSIFEHGQNILPNNNVDPSLVTVKPYSFANVSLNERQMAVVGAFKHAWAGYKKFAWGHDHLKPISGKYHDWFKLGLSITDSLDTMYIMGLKEELAEAKEWVSKELNLNEYNDVNLFEVTIRVLGGLLSAYHLTADTVFLEKAKDLGDRLLPCFTRSPSPIPYSDVNLASHTAHSPSWGPDSSTSEVTTLQLEFRALSRATNDPKYENAASKVSEHVHGLPKTDGLVPVFIDPRTGRFKSMADIKLGARGDSYYEYLVKQWIQTGKTTDYLRDDYLEAINGIRKHLVRRTPNDKYLYIGELKEGNIRKFVPKMDHLVCYLPGTLALGYYHGLPEQHLELAQELLYTCYKTYSERPTFLAPEITFFNLQSDGRGDMYVKSNDAHNLLRPEFIESLWYMYQVTGNKTFQDWGWTIFQAFEKFTKVENGYTSISNVNNPGDTKPRDMMESFFLSETLKYSFLLFADDRKFLDINNFVMNSEGHPLPVYNS